jgi:fimbrial chaperone protein
MRPNLARYVGAALIFLAQSGVADATSLKIYPVLIELDAKTPVETMTIENSSDAPARMQVRVVAWRQDNGQDLFEDTRDILANPPLFEVAPGAQQIARFGLRTAPGLTEKSYRIFLEEIPNGRPTAPGEVRTLLRVSIPIFVPSPDAQPKLVWQIANADDKQLMLTVHNGGSAHVHLKQITLKHADGAALGSQQESLYILSGATRTVQIATQGSVRPGEKLTLDAISDQKTMTFHLSGSFQLLDRTASGADGLR